MKDTPGIPCSLGQRAALVVDDEAHVLEKVATWLATAGWRCVLTGSTIDALRESKDPNLAIALIDYRLPSGDDGIRLGRAIRARRGLPFVIMSGFLNTTIVVEAVRAGAIDVIDKPLTEGRIVSSLRGFGSSAPSRHILDATVPRISGFATVESDIQTPTIRWARYVLKACSAENDLRRVADWAAAAATSGGTIDEICRLCKVYPSDSRDLARTLRAIMLARRTGTPVSMHFAVADDRTLRGLLDRAGFTRSTRTVALQEFFVRQVFIPTTKPCLHELAHRSANSPLFF